MATESFFSSASLAYLASAGAGKDGKAYSIKPTDGTGDFTFSRGSNLAATRVGADGLIEKGRENLLTYSNDFSNSAWSKTSGSSFAGGQSGYDGSSDAWLFTDSGSISSYGAYQDKVVNGVHTYSIYVKEGSTSTFKIDVFPSGNPLATIDLTNGDVSASNEIDAKSELISNGWYRLSLSFNASSTLYMRFGCNGAGSVYIQDAQLEIGLAATDYIESGATTGKAGLLEDEPRFDYSGGATCPSLLLEPSRTNVVGYSEYHSGTYYGNNNVTTTDNEAVSPEGVQNAAKIVLDSGTNTSNGGHHLSFSSTAGTTYTISVFAKAGEMRYFTFTYGSSSAGGGHFDLQEGTLLGTITSSAYRNETASIEDYGNGWYKLVVSLKDNAIVRARFLSMKPSPSANVPNNNNYPSTGDGTSGAYIYGLQVEQASYPTSYIPNHSGGSVTRGGDNCSTSNNSLLEQTSATYFLELTPIEIVSNNFIEVRGDGTTNNRILFQTTISGSIRVLVRTQGSSILDTNVSNAVSKNTKVKIALKYTPSNISFFVDGVKKINTNISVDFNPKLNGLDLEGSATLNDDALKQHQFLFFPTALTDSECIALTTL